MTSKQLKILLAILIILGITLLSFSFIVEEENLKSTLNNFAFICLGFSLLDGLILMKQITSEEKTKKIQKENEKELNNSITLGILNLRTLNAITVSNISKYKIENVQISGIAKESTYNQFTQGELPIIETENTEIKNIVYPITGLWFQATITELIPGSNISLFKYHLDESNYKLINFQIKWIDHTGLQRKLNGNGDLNKNNSVDLKVVV